MVCWASPSKELAAAAAAVNDLSVSKSIKYLGEDVDLGLSLMPFWSAKSMLFAQLVVLSYTSTGPSGANSACV